MSKNHYKKLENLYHQARCNEYYSPCLTIQEGMASVQLECAEKFHHAAHAAHGSLYFKLLDDATFFAVNSLVEDVFVLTSQFNLYLLRPVVVGRIKAEGRVVSRSKNIFIAEGQLFNSENQEIARGTGQFMRSKIILDEKVGYK